MSRRVSKPAAAVLAIVFSLTLSAPAAYAGYRNRDVNPGLSPRIIKIVKQLAKKFGMTIQEDLISPAPPKP